MLQSVIETPDFLRDADRAGLTAEERGRIVTRLAREPTAGVDIPGTGGARSRGSPDAGKAKAVATG